MSNTYNSGSPYDSGTVTFDGGAVGDKTNLPVLGVFMAFGASPYAADPDWSEITSYVRSVSISRGRSDDYEQFRAGTASLTLDNRQRIFDPFNTSSPYNGQLLPRTQIKIVAQANGGNYTIFRGYCAGFPVKFINNGADSTINLDCFDAFGLIAATELPLDWSYQLISELNPMGYYRCDDPAGSTVVTDRGSMQLNAIAASPDAANAQKGESLAKNLGFGSMNSQINPLGSAWVETTAQFGNYYFDGMTFGGFLQCNSPNGFGALNDCLNAQSWMGNLLAQVAARYDPATQTTTLIFRCYVQASASTFTLNTYTFTNTISISDAFHFAITINRDPFTVTTYLNGREITATPVVTTVSTTPRYNFSYRFAYGQEFFNVDRVLTADEISDIYFSAAGQLYENTSDRASRFLDLTGYSSALIDLTSLPVGTVSSIPSSGFVLPALQRTADSEGGEVFVNREGVITFVNRFYAFGQGSNNAPEIAFGEQSGGQPFSDVLEIMYDADSIRNEVAVQFADGGQVTASVPSSITDYGRSDQTISTDLSTVTDATNLATVEATVSAVLQPTISPVQVGTTRSAAQWANILNLDLLDKYSVSYTPSTGSAFTKDLLLNSITYDLTPDSWQVSIGGSSRLCGWFCADVSFTDGSDVVL